MVVSQQTSIPKTTTSITHVAVKPSSFMSLATVSSLWPRFKKSSQILDFWVSHSPGLIRLLYVRDCGLHEEAIITMVAGCEDADYITRNIAFCLSSLCIRSLITNVAEDLEKNTI